MAQHYTANTKPFKHNSITKNAATRIWAAKVQNFQK